MLIQKSIMKKIATILLLLCLISKHSKGQWMLIDSILPSGDCIGTPTNPKIHFINDTTLFWFFTYQGCSPTSFPYFAVSKTSDLFSTRQNLFDCNPCTDPVLTFLNSDTIFDEHDYWSQVYTCRKSTDGGLNWTTMYCPFTSNNVRLFFINSSKGYGFDGNTFLRFRNDSILPLSQVTNFSIIPRQATFKSSGEGCVLISNNAGGMGKRLIRTVDEGQTWTTSFFDSNRNLNYIQFFNDSAGVLVADSGYVYKTLDYGNTWNLLLHDTSNCLLKFVNPQTVYYTKNFSNSHCTFNYSSDAGTTWSSQQLPPSIGFQAYLFKTGSAFLLTLGSGSNFNKSYIYKNNIVTTSIKNIFHSVDKLQITPNPFSENSTLSIPLPLQGKNVILSVYNAMGKLVQQVYLKKAGEKFMLELGYVARGLYTIILSDGESNYNGKFILE